jgi:serine/threonine protein kinase
MVADVLEHLDHCVQCEETVGKLEHTLQSVLPGAAATMVDLPFAEESGCQRAIQSLVTEFSAAGPKAHPERGAKPVSEPVSPPEFQTLRDFRIVEKVGQGGMGAVYKAVHQRMQRTVALKVLPSGLIGDQSAVARFNREMSVLGQLNHPNIVQAFDAGEHDGQHYLAMEFIEGQDLANVLRKHRRLSIPNACLATAQVASALQYAHEKGFVHRDIKPSNLMLAEVVGSDGNPQAIVKLLDLGLARVFETTVEHDKPSSELTSDGQIMGTLDYMAPEQGTDSHQVDIRTDIYSLGATLYKFLTGETPFADHAAKPPIQRLMAMATLEPPRITSKRPDIPEKLAAIVHRALEKDPARRFQTPVELLRALDEFTSGANLLSLMRPELQVATDDQRSKAVTTSLPRTASSHGSGKRGARRGLALLGGFSAFILLAAILVLTTRHGRIEVTSPDGTLPADLKVAVSNGGESVEVLQADNQWSAKVINGEYQLHLTGGDDKFEIKDSKLTVSRMGKTIVVVELRKKDALTAANAKTPDVSDPRSKMPDRKAVAPAKTPDPSSPPTGTTEMNVAAKVNPEKPFALIRAGGDAREFKTWAGALSELQAGDVVEISGQGPYRMPGVPFNHLNVTVRAAEGSRPELVFNGMVYHNGSLQLHGVDLICRDARQDEAGELASYTVDSHWVISSCRIKAYGLNLSRQTKLRVSDSLLLVGAIGISGDGTTAEFHNNVIVATHFGFNLGEAADWTADAQFTLTNNTIVVVTRRVGAPWLFRFGLSNSLPAKTLHINARNNLFALDGGPIHGQACANITEDPKNPDAILWQGEGNLYCPYPHIGKTTKAADGTEVVEHPLDTWARWMKREEREPGSQIAAWPHWQMAAAKWAEDTTAIAALQHQVDSSIPPELRHEVGPNWQTLGVGDSYLRALAASGRVVAESDLRPEAIGGGACVILRNGQEHQGFLTLQEAIDASANNDIIELRTDRNVGTGHNQDVQRQLTIRAAAGYSPEVATIRSGRLNLEGLRFAPGEMVHGTDASLEVPAEQMIRITNCLFPSTEQKNWDGVGSVSIYIESVAKGVPIIFQNCWMEGTVELNIHPGQPIRFENCVLPRVRSGNHYDKSKAGKKSDATPVVQFDRCALWSPYPRHARAELITSTLSPPELHHMEVVAERTLFEANGSIQDEGLLLSLSGKKNLFRIGSRIWFVTPGDADTRLNVSCLADARQGTKPVTESFEGHPLAWDPAQWKLLPSSPGFQAGPDGKDIGADVQQVARSEVRDARLKTPNGKAVPPLTMVPAPPNKANVGSPEAPVIPGKPFRVVRQEKLVRDFTTLTGALADLQAGDVIEILSNERLIIRAREPITKPLHLRAGAGFRPVLDFSGHKMFDIQSDFTVEGCDLDWRDEPQRHSDHQGVWKIHNCRVWGAFRACCKSISFENSILIGAHTGVAFSRSCNDATFDNCLIRYRSTFIAADSPKLHLKLNNCTFHVFSHGSAGLVHEWGTSLAADSQLTVEATGNAFNFRLVAGQWIPQSSQSKIRWIGKENLFCGNWFHEWEPDGENWKIVRSGLVAWNSWLKTPEQGTHELPDLALEWGRVQRLDGPEFLQGVKKQVEQIQQREQLTDVGLNWDIIGPGDAYVRALAAEGKPVAEADLRPERLEAGPIVLLHAGAEPRGFLQLSEALDAAVDQDVIEIRTDGLIPDAKWTGENRVLTIRAAPGYSPTIDGGLTSSGTDRLIVEGLTLRHGFLASGYYMQFENIGDGSKAIYPSNGSFIRIANCQVLENTHISGWFATGTDTVPEIVNCISPSIQVGLHSAGSVNIRNSVVKHLNANLENNSASQGRVACDHCVFWRPAGGESVHDDGQAVASATPVKFVMDHSLFAAKFPHHLNSSHPDHPPVWSGNHNTYICSYTHEGFRLMQSLQEKFKSDADSVELFPWEFDPAQWRILREATPGYEPKSDGTDYGARIDDLIEAMK